MVRDQAAHTDRGRRTSWQRTATSSSALRGAGAAPPTQGSVHAMNPATPAQCLPYGYAENSCE